MLKDKTCPLEELASHQEERPRTANTKECASELDGGTSGVMRSEIGGVVRI